MATFNDRRLYAWHVYFSWLAVDKVVPEDVYSQDAILNEKELNRAPVMIIQPTCTVPTSVAFVPQSPFSMQINVTRNRRMATFNHEEGSRGAMQKFRNQKSGVMAFMGWDIVGSLSSSFSRRDQLEETEIGEMATL